MCPEKVRRLCEAARGDARWLLNALQFESKGHGGLVAAPLDKEETDEMGVAKSFLYMNPQGDALSHFEGLCSKQETYTLASLVHENYPLACGRDVNTMSIASTRPSDADLFEAGLHRLQDWSLMDHMMYCGPIALRCNLVEERRNATGSQKWSDDPGLESDSVVSIGNKKRTGRGTKRTIHEGSINLPRAWSKMSYAASRIKKIVELRGRYRSANRQLVGVDLEWLSSFSTIVRAKMHSANDDKDRLKIIVSIAQDYNFDVLMIDDALKFMGESGLTRSMLRKVGEALAIAA